MVLVNIIAIIILFFSFIGGLGEGAVKTFFSLITLFVAIPLTGMSYSLLASLFSFLPGENWENFIGFFITMGIIMVILFLVFLIPRGLARKLWNKGVYFRIVGGVLNLLNAAMGLVVFALLLAAYPIFEWLEQAVTGSSVLAWLIVNLRFVDTMLPF